MSNIQPTDYAARQPNTAPTFSPKTSVSRRLNAPPRKKPMHDDINILFVPRYRSTTPCQDVLLCAILTTAPSTRHPTPSPGMFRYSALNSTGCRRRPSTPDVRVDERHLPGHGVHPLRVAVAVVVLFPLGYGKAQRRRHGAGQVLWGYSRHTGGGL